MNYFIARKERKHGTSLRGRQGRSVYTGQYRSRMHGLAVTKTIRQYRASLDFKSKLWKATRILKDYILNEQQATLLVTFLKNTEQLVNFKTNLVQAFFKKA